MVESPSTVTNGSIDGTAALTVSTARCTQNVIAELWGRHRSTNIDRVVELEDAALALLEGHLSDGQRDRARSAAHKLAGSLGTFGFQSGTDAAREAELLLGSDDVDGRQLAELVVAIQGILDQDPEELPPDPADPPTPVPIEDNTTGRGTVLFSLDVDLAEQLAIAMQTAGVELERLDDEGAVNEAIRTGSAAAVIVDLDDADRGLHLLTQLSDNTTIELMALAATEEPNERLAVARSRAIGYIPRAMPAARIARAVEQLQLRRTPVDAVVVAVDDDPGVLDAIGALLGAHAVKVVAVPDPESFWEILEETEPDTVIVDVDMPGVTGVELCRMVRSDPRRHRLPVLVLTANRDEKTMRAAFAAGADDYIFKPFTELELAIRVTTHLDRHRLFSALTSTDAVTGVRTRASGERHLTRMVHLAGRQGQPVTVSFIDIDDFAQVTAQSGRAAADTALRITAEILSEQLRTEDLISRWAESTFVVGLYGVEAEPAAERIATLVRHLRSHRFSGIDGRPFTLKIAAGIAQFPTDGTDVDAVCRAADLARHQARETATGARIAGRAGTDIGGVRQCDVLIVDDDDMLADLLEHTLTTQGYVVSRVADGLEAAELLTSGVLRTRLVLLDVGLPGLDGFGVLRRLRDNGVLESTDVVMLTARSAADETLEALELGAVNHISKPFSVPILMERLNKLLRGSRG